MQSPQTSSRAGMVCHLPSRHAVAVGAVRLRRDSSVCSVRYSCKKPRIALSRTMRIMVTASVISPRNAEMPVAASRINTITSRNCPRNMRRGRRFAAAASSFSPSCFSRSRAALVVRPFMLCLLSFPSFVQCCPSSFHMMFLFVATICGKAKKHDHIGKLFVKITRNPLTIVPNSCII